MAKVRSERGLVDQGMRLLVDALGYSGAARFVRHFSRGNGEHLKVQEKLFKGMRLHQIYKKPARIIPVSRFDSSQSAALFRRFENSRNVEVSVRVVFVFNDLNGPRTRSGGLNPSIDSGQAN